MKLKIQPLILGKELSRFWGEAPVMAAEAWTGDYGGRGPAKPRNKLRRREVPPTDVSLEALQDGGMVEVNEIKRIRMPEELEEIPEDVDAFLLHVFESLLAPDEILEGLVSIGKPILGDWDNWGFSWHGRYSNLRREKYSNARFYWPFGANEVTEILSALRAQKKIRKMTVVYIGDIPPHSVERGDKTFDFDYLHRRFGTEFVHLDFSDYLEVVENISDDDVGELAEKWEDEYEIVDGREKRLGFYPKIYLGLKELLEKHNASSVTIDCAWLPDVEYVPCFAFSRLIDEGIVAACEADIPTLYMMAAIMGVSGKPVMMGNLNENATHSDVESNIVVINHDVVPPSMGCSKCKLRLRDFHATGKGLTPYVDLDAGRTVTLAGMHQDMNKIWATRGNIQWSEDTTYCRISVGVKVDNARAISKNAFGHHITLTYGDHRGSLKKLADLFKMEYVSL